MFDNKEKILKLYKNVLCTMKKEYDFKEKIDELIKEMKKFKDVFYDNCCHNSTESDCSKNCPFDYICQRELYELDNEKLSFIIKYYEEKIKTLEKEIELKNTKHCCENCKNLLFNARVQWSGSKGITLVKYCKLMSIKLENPEKTICDKFDIKEKLKDETQNIKEIYNFRKID